MPSYSRILFSEFVGYLGIGGLLLALTGLAALVRKQERARVMPGALLACVGLFFALGAYNPLYWPLVEFAPGFDLFRVPARWIALWALGAALLAGIGFDRITTLPSQERRRLALAFFAWLAPRC